MSLAFDQEDRLLAMASPLGDAIVPYRLFGEEALARPYRFEVHCYTAESLKAEDLLGQVISVTLSYAGAQRIFSGIVSSLSSEGWVARNVRGYRVEIVPELWRLTLRSGSRVFQKMNLPDIIEKILSDAKVARVERRLNASYSELATVTQYDETDFAFVSRLMERAGITYYFTHATSGSTLVLIDSVSGWQTSDPANLTLRETEGRMAGVLTSWSERSALVARSAEVEDHDPINPSLKLNAKETTGIAHLGALPTGRRESPAGFTEAGAAADLARLRQEEEEVEALISSASSHTPQFLPGTKFTLTLPGAAEDGKSYAIASLRHEAKDVLHFNRRLDEQPSYSNWLTCVAADLTYRPPRRTPRPQIRGPHTAPVVGPSGEEIHTDEYGRVKLRLFWDRDGTENDEGVAWVPVVQSLAGRNWGSFALPRIGMEAVVEFLYGDPDRPLVIGCIPGSEAKPPFPLPDEKTRTGLRTRSTPGGDATTFNELRFEDKKDSEQVFLQAQKDFERIVKNDDRLEVQRDRSIEIKRHLKTSIEEGDVSFTVKAGGRTSEIKKGDDALKLGEGKATVQIEKGDLSVTLGAGDGTVKADGGKLVFEAAKSIKLTVGSSSVEITTSSVIIKAGSSEVALSASGVSIKGMKVGIQGDAQAEIKSAMTTVESSGILTLKGSMTKIN
jgi:type VI secretion system secreted protein VgrG